MTSTKPKNGSAAPNDSSDVEPFRKYARNNEVVERFSEVVGEHNARAYITSVVLAVANSPALQECTNQSIISAALQAASLRLSVDPSLRQAALVPFKGKAVLIPMVKGLVDLATRTGRYRYIHVHELHGEQTVEFDPFSGKPKLVGNGGVMEPVTGYVATFEMMNGFSKTIYMTVEEIDEHGKKYSKGFNKADGLWQTNRPVMRRKTILRRLLNHWGYMDPNDQAVLDQLEADLQDDQLPDGEFVDAEARDVVAPPAETAPEIIQQLGFDVAPAETGPVKTEPIGDHNAFWKYVRENQVDEQMARNVLMQSSQNFDDALALLEGFSPVQAEETPA